MSSQVSNQPTMSVHHLNMEPAMFVKPEDITPRKPSNTPTSQPSFSVHNLNMELASQAPQFVKLEELDNSAAHDSPQTDVSEGSPAPTDATSNDSGSQSKPVKKRKSWGQELPEPTTNLPPRKRAKTEAEKEQRRIERVKRNRQAAHNSRERKRMEHETLYNEKSTLENEVDRLKQLNHRLMEELAIYRSGGQPSPSSFTESNMATSTPQSDSITSSANVTPLLSNITSPPSEAAPYTPSLDSIHDLELTQQSAVSLDINGNSQCGNFNGASVEIMDEHSHFSLDSLFDGCSDMDFTLFEGSNDTLQINNKIAAKATTAQRPHHFTPVQPPSVSPITPFSVLDAAPLVDHLDDPFSGSLFPDVHSSSGAVFTSDEHGLAAGEVDFS